ncbi:hypothetical protein HNQ91_003725 [Filimonas zeae]|uniref:DUF4870 domain-containing protein n=1 Tax=Filimonas zeae TaxID=1737353 RepID=A0A917IZU7_9BACT|nr:DUF4870 domain-containing protein [Filimonas zeae]MDR6340660.1 hypothetical protein [Filimonas zeae]GGH73770.1 hypothetical protein GCM10011379_35660 [Filimonas zeae]
MTTREQDVRTWSMLCHISALAGLLFSLGSLLGPLLAWQLKKNELPEIEEHGKESLNFQITVILVSWILKFIFVPVIGAGLLFGGPFSAIGNGLGIGSVYLLVNLLGWILAVVAGIQANNGGFYRYPLCIRFIK